MTGLKKTYAIKDLITFQFSGTGLDVAYPLRIGLEVKLVDKWGVELENAFKLWEAKEGQIFLPTKDFNQTVVWQPSLLLKRSPTFKDMPNHYYRFFVTTKDGKRYYSDEFFIRKQQPVKKEEKTSYYD